MVDKEIIESVISSVTSNVVGKCWTKAQIREKLSGLTYQDQAKQLKEKSLLNPLEEKDIHQVIEEYEYYYNRWNKIKDTDEVDKDHVRTYLQKLEDELFQYGRRLIEGYETSLAVDLDDYKDKMGQADEQIPMWETDEFGDEILSYEIKTDLGHIEEKTIELQEKSIHVDPDDITEEGVMNDKRLLSMDNYFSGDTNHINYHISHEGYINKLDNVTRQHMKNIDSLMKESTGLPYNTLLFRGGTFDIHTRVGETISFKGYTSTTFQKEVAEWYNNDKYDGMVYLIHAPKGTKGISGNDERFYNGFEEHEYVLPRNTRMKVINIDYDNMVCEVVIE